MSKLIRLPALTTVMAARLPKRGPQWALSLFSAVGDMTVDCDVVDELTGKRCGWHAMGPRFDVQKALAEHRRMFHSQATGPIVTLINQPRQ